MVLPLVGALIPSAIAIAASDAHWWIVVFPIVVFPTLLILFHSLTITVTASEVTAAFGIGVIRKTVLLEDVEEVSATKSRWFHGWGIRKVKRGWLFNVSGFNVVSMTLKNGRIVQFGTDEPEELLVAIQTALSESE